MTIKSSCSWCHEENQISDRFCLGCGHEAHKPRGACRCEKCTGSPWGAGLFPGGGSRGARLLSGGAGALALAVVMTLGLLLSGAREAGAHSHPYTRHDVPLADSDGVYREVYTCRLPEPVLGRYLYRENPDGTVEGKILYDSCNMAAAGAGPTDWRNLKAHERAHARGLKHGQGTPATNPAYERGIRICRC